MELLPFDEYFLLCVHNKNLYCIRSWHARCKFKFCVFIDTSW